MPYLNSDALDDTLLLEQQESFAGGMDEYSRSSLLRPDQFQRGINTIVADNFTLKTRVGADALGAAAINGANAIQGVFYYDTPAPYEQVLACANGAWFVRSTLTLATAWTADASWTADTAARIAGAQLVEKLYCTDGVGQWRYWDGAVWTGLGTVVGPLGGPPVGALVVAAHNQRLFASGNGSLPDTVWASGVLDAGATGWDHVNFKFRVGHGEGDPVRALIPLQNFNLLVLKEGSVWLLNTPPTAATANDFRATRMPANFGCVGTRAWAASGNDVLFMAQDGVRSVRRMESSGEQYEVTAPLSLPIQPWIDRINWAYASKICALRYEHLVLFAVPVDSATSPSHVLVWNERLQSWNGVWTGWTPMMFCVSHFGGIDRLLVADTAGRVNLWKDADDESSADTFKDNSVVIATTMRLRGLVFGEPVSNKDPDFWEVRFVETHNTASISIYLDESMDYGPNSVSLPQLTVTLPVMLPFTLPTLKPRDIRRELAGADGIRSCRELSLEVSASSGKIAVRSFTVGAFLDTVLNSRSSL